MSEKKKLTIRCKACGYENVFDQPYAFHAGFGNQGFRYNDAGTMTLIWSSFDAKFRQLFPGKHPWALTQSQRLALEERLKPAPHGGRWKFSNPARCKKCSAPISGPMTETIYYLQYPDSLDLDHEATSGLKSCMIQSYPSESAIN